MTQPTILVTAANGNVGRQAVAELRRRGATVRAGVHSPDRASNLREQGAEVVALDFDQPESVRAAFAGIDRVLLIQPFGPSIPAHGSDAVQAARAADVQHVVRISAIGADPAAELNVARWHGQVDAALAETGLGYTILQPTFFQDNLLTFQAAPLRSDGAFYGASGDGRASYVSSADVARSAAAVLLDPAPHAGKRYVLTGGEALSDQEVAGLASSAFGREVRYVDLEPEQLAASMTGSGSPDWAVEGLVGLERVKAAGWAVEVSPAVADLTGAAPERYADFLARHRDALA